MTLETGQDRPRTSRCGTSTAQHVSLSSFRGSKAVAADVLPLRVQPVLHRRAVRRPGPPADLRVRHRPGARRSPATRCSRCGPSPTQDGLTFPLLSDFWPHGAAARAYGVFDEERGCSDRSTFVVDREGVLRWAVHSAMREARDLDEQARVLAEVA